MRCHRPKASTTALNFTLHFLIYNFSFGKNMATSFATPRVSSHTRSISLPSRSHPLTASIDELLCRLSASEPASSPSSSTMCSKLDGLKDLYEHVVGVLQLPLVQQALSHEHHEKWVEDSLNGSLRALDLCNASRDAFSDMRACVQDLETSLRRRNNQESDLSTGIRKYLTSTRRVNKMVNKQFANLKKMGSNQLEAVYKSQEIAAITSMLKEVEAVTITVFEPLVSTVCPLNVKSKPRGWSLVSKLMQTKRVDCEGCNKEDSNLLQKIDRALETLYKSSEKLDLVSVQQVQKLLKTLELSMQVYEQKLECMFRLFIKTRVSLLNVLNH